LRHSYAYRFLSDGAKTLRFAVKDLLGVPLDDVSLTDDKREPAWELQLALLAEIDRLARAKGIPTLLLIIPDQLQVQTDARVLGIQPADYEVQERLLEFSRRTGMPALDLRAPLRAAYERDRVALYYPRDRHLNAIGHAIVGQALLEEIERLGLRPAAPHAG
jgi:hypothetical protein